mmetsp:Transcript_65348/g.202256  ORF Transcript_65348/g.202256 Transcript_65348/m.202256 type:complete len:355 (+) Transcript_65348:968-2032(+)
MDRRCKLKSCRGANARPTSVMDSSIMELFLPQTYATRCSSSFCMFSCSCSLNSTTGFPLSAFLLAVLGRCLPSSSESSSSEFALLVPTFTRDVLGGKIFETKYCPGTVALGASRGSGMESGFSERGCSETKYFTEWYQETCMSGAAGCNSNSSKSTSRMCGRSSCSSCHAGGKGGGRPAKLMSSGGICMSSYPCAMLGGMGGEKLPLPPMPRYVGAGRGTTGSIPAARSDGPCSAPSGGGAGKGGSGPGVDGTLTPRGGRSIAPSGGGGCRTPGCGAGNRGSCICGRATGADGSGACSGTAIPVGGATRPGIAARPGTCCIGESVWKVARKSASTRQTHSRASSTPFLSASNFA